DPALGAARVELARCGRCGSAVTLGPAPAGRYDSGAYRPGAPRLHGAAQGVLRLFDKQRLALVRSLVPAPATVVDGGAGRGGVGAPSAASLQARLGGARWYRLDAPRHRVHFTPVGLRALLDSRGFTVLSVRHTLLEHNPFGMWQSLLSRITRHPSYVYNLLKRNAPLRSPDLAIAAMALPAAPIAATLELLAGAMGLGGTIAVLARRRA